MKKTILILLLLLVPFIALAESPTVATENATEIGLNTALLNGRITSHGRTTNEIYNQSKVWFEYGKTLSYGSQTSKTTITGVNSFSQKVSLSSCTLYHFRAAAENPSEKSYGQDVSFYTPCKIKAQVSVEVKNLTSGDGNYHSAVNASAFDKLSIKISVDSTGTATAKDVKVKNNLPQNIIFLGNLKIAGVSDTRDFTKEAINIDDLAPGESKTITFEAQVGASSNLPTGVNSLVNTVLAYTEESASSGSCTIIVTGTGVGTPTGVNTGIGTDILYSVLLPLFVAFLFIWIFKSQILGLDKEVEKRKEKVGDYRAEKKLKKMVKKRK